MIADDLRGPNALMVGPDGKLYFPLVPQGEVWRVDVETGAKEKVVDGLKSPPAVKFNRKGELIVPQAGNGEVVRIDVQSGTKTVIAKVRPGIDNFTFTQTIACSSHILLTVVSQKSLPTEAIPSGHSYRQDSSGHGELPVALRGNYI